jgi:hypothetical protein
MRYMVVAMATSPVALRCRATKPGQGTSSQWRLPSLRCVSRQLRSSGHDVAGADGRRGAQSAVENILWRARRLMRAWTVDSQWPRLK